MSSEDVPVCLCVRRSCALRPCLGVSLIRFCEKIFGKKKEQKIAQKFAQKIAVALLQLAFSQTEIVCNTSNASKVLSFCLMFFRLLVHAGTAHLAVTRRTTAALTHVHETQELRAAMFDSLFGGTGGPWLGRAVKMNGASAR